MSNREQRVEKEQYWRLVLDEFGGSGLTAREFCKREGLREPSFYAWRKEIRRRDGDVSSAKPNHRRGRGERNMRWSSTKLNTVQPKCEIPV